MCAVYGSAINGNAQFCRLNDGVLLGMDGIAQLRPGTRSDLELIPQALPPLAARGHTRRRTIVAGGHDALILHDDRADGSPTAKTAGPIRYEPGRLHETLIPFIHHIPPPFVEHYTVTQRG